MSSTFEKALTVYRLGQDEIDGVDGLGQALQELSSLVGVETSEEEWPAAVNVYGIALKVLLSDPVEALVTAAAVGDILWRIIEVLKRSGKRFSVHKPAMKCLVPAKMKQDGEVDDESLGYAKAWGPMVVSLDRGSLLERYRYRWEEMPAGEGYLMAIAFPRKRRRVRTRWTIMSSSGEILLSWVTQTFAERVPEFLRPG